MAPAEAASRRRGDPDRIESEGAEFAEEVDRAYREIARVFSKRVAVVDGSLNPEDIAEIVRGQLRDLP
jgi:thymidylate kinase